MNVINPLGPIEVVCVAERNIDPAIDVEASDIDKYLLTRDPSCLVIKAGMTPTKFVLKQLKAMYLSDVIEAHSAPSRRIMLAFLTACHEVKLANGTSLVPAKLNPDPVYGVIKADEEFYQRVNDECGMDAIREMGYFIMRRAGVGAKGLGPFDWPPGSTS